MTNHKLTYKIFLTAFLCTFSILLRAQSNDSSLYFNRIMSENIVLQNGLSQNNVSAIVQDDQGLMWFGTWYGLNCYDGYTFKVFKKEQGLSNESIRSLFVQNDTLWIGTENGLNMMELKTGKITVFYSDNQDSASVADNKINHVCGIQNGQIMISTQNGLCKYDSKTNSFSSIYLRSFANAKSSNIINHVANEPENKNTFIATGNGLAVYNSNKRSITKYFNIPHDESSLPDNHVTRVCVADSNNVFVGTKNGIAQFFYKEGVFKKMILPLEKGETFETEEITDLCADKERLWIATNGGGLYCYNFTDKTILRYVSQQNEINSLSDNRIFSIYISKNNTMWVGTYNGLNKIDNFAPRFRLFRSSGKHQNTLSNNSVWCFLEVEPDILWIGTDEGINIFNVKTSEYQIIKKQENNKNGLIGNSIRSFYRDSKGLIWIGTQYSGISCYNPKTKKFKNYTVNPKNSKGLCDPFIYNIIEDYLGNIWVATPNGLGKLNPKTDLFINYFFNEKDKSSLPDNCVYCFYIDEKHNLYISTDNGIARYRYETDDFEKFAISEEQLSQSLVANNKFFSMTPNGDGKIWLGSRGGGMYLFNPENNTFLHYEKKDGLPDNLIYNIQKDKNGNLWISTNKGVSRFNPESETFVNYDATDGLQGNDFNLNASLITSRGKILFGGMNGFNSFFPEEISVNPTPPPVIITSFKKMNVVYHKRLQDGDTIFLEYYENFFTFDFSALDFINSIKNKYRYKLENFDENWISRDADKRFAEYTQVSPGTYVFRVIACNSSGYWNNEGVNITIIIHPAWYQTWWFYVLLFSVFVILVYLSVNLRMRYVKHEHDVERQQFNYEKQLYKLKQKSLQLQMNPHVLFNTLNSIQFFVINNDTDNALHYLSKFSQYMRRLLNNSTQSYITLKDELEALETYIEIESLRFGDKFEYKIEVSPNIDEEFTEIPPLILQPYVENAIIHGLMNKKDKGHLIVNISFESDSETILCIIQDDGVGRERASQIRKESGIERKSLGMLITKERLNIMNRYTEDQYTVDVIDLFDDEGKSKGTRVEVRIRIKEDQ